MNKNINARRAAKLREAISGGKHHKEKTGLLSNIYPAFAPGPTTPTKPVAPTGLPDGDPEDDEYIDELEDSKDKEPKEEDRTSPFVQRCVAAITGGSPSSKDELSGAFAKCVSTENKSDKPLSKRALERKGYSASKSKFVKAINRFKKKGHA